MHTNELPALEPSAGWLNLAPRRPAKATVLHFWAVSCGWCKAQMPSVRRWLADPEIEVISVHTPLRASDTDRALIERTARAVGLANPIALDMDGKIADAFGVMGLPTYFVYDGRGLVTSAAGAGADLRVDEALRTPRGAAAAGAPR